MTAQELIDRLREYPPDAAVRIRAGDSSTAALLVDGDEVVGPPAPMGTYGTWGS